MSPELPPSRPALRFGAAALLALASCASPLTNRPVGDVTPAALFGATALPKAATAASGGTTTTTAAHLPQQEQDDPNTELEDALAMDDVAAPKVAPPAGKWAVGGFDAVGVATTAVVAAVLAPVVFSNDDEEIQRVGDVTQILTPVAAGVLSLAVEDYEGTIQFAKSLITATATTHTLKFIVDKTRPDQTENNSFPSGHTQGAFSGASFINRRYGPRFGVPAYVLAVYTGASRVVATRHYGDDVLAGASIALFANWLFTEPLYVAGTAVSPVVNNDMIGVSVDLTPPPQSRSRRGSEPLAKKIRYELLFGPADMKKNDITLPRDSPGSLAVTDFQNNANPQVVAMGQLEWFFAEDQELDFRWFPYEIRDSGNFARNTSFAGENFTQGTAADSDFILYDYRARYRYRFSGAPWDIRLGVGVAIQDISQEIRTQTVQVRERAIESFTLLHARLGYQFHRKWLAFVESDFTFDANSHAVDASAIVRYRANSSWDFNGGYRYISQFIDSSEIRHELDIRMLQLGIGYSM
ncbi:MAG: phosphatase PAP2 family protein [Planctomycetota bacterium]